MEHLAIMRKSWGLTPKILDGRKKIESRWYSTKRKPWDSIKKGEIVYFKDSGDPVMLKAEVDRVLQFENLTPIRVREILNMYGEEDGLELKDMPEFFNRFKGKKYCILVFLKNPKKTKPFEVDKKGFGLMSAWISADDILSIKK